MNSSRRQPRAPSFTVIELLLVITIIVILMSLLMVGIHKARDQAELQRARVEVSNLYGALRSYHADYGVWPYTDEAIHSADNALMQMLGGGNGLGNTKQRLYLSLKSNQTNSAGAFVDPWGNPYRVLCDGTGNAADGGVPSPFGPAGLTSPVPLMVWSSGPDGQSDTGGDLSNKNKDNLKSY